MVTQNAIDSQKPIQSALGGTGRSSLTNHSVLVGAGTGAITQLSVGTSGQLLVGSSAADPVFATVTASAVSLTYTTGAGSLNIDVANWKDKTSWTPGVAFGGGATGITYTTQTGFYCRIGNLIYIVGTIVLSAVGSSTGSATITGLPVTTNSTQTYVFDCVMQNMTTSLATEAIFGSSSNTTTISLYIQQLTGITAITNANFSSTTQLNFTGWYPV